MFLFLHTTLLLYTYTLYRLNFPHTPFIFPTLYYLLFYSIIPCGRPGAAVDPDAAVVAL
jgi:hypothetical protein